MTSTDARAKILIVDDQPENLVALDALLSGLGQDILKANSGREALKLLLNEEVALILLDIQMPDMDGFETANLVRQRDVSKHTPIIFLTAMYTEDVYESEAYTLGAVDFITKPFAAHVLLSKVHFFVDLFKKNQRIQTQARVIREIEERRLVEVQERLETEKQLIQAELARKEKEAELLEERSTQLQNADRLKDEFLANMSHEIRTPMNAVIGFSELLLGTELDNEQSEFAVRIKDSAQGLLTLINDILDLSKIVAGKLDLEPVTFELAPLIEGTAAILSESAREKKLSLMTYIDPELPRMVIGDPGRLRQILLNLTGNAIKFTEQGEVVVRATATETKPGGDDGATAGSGDGTKPVTLSVAISDTGIGLSESEIARLFRPFTQADGSTTRRFGGTGLGLSISKRLVELMGGEIGVTSTPGKGATFWFTITLSPSDAAPRRKHVLPDSCNDTKILVIDRQVSARKIVESYISSWHLHCEVTDNLDDAFDMLKARAHTEDAFDLVLTELNLHDGDGFELLDAIRQESELSDTKVILFTHEDKQGLGELALSKGFSAYLTKPIEQSSLYDCIAKVLWSDLEDRKISEVRTTSGSYIQFAPMGTTILLAEDNPVNQMVTQLQLKKLGYECSVVSNGQEAVQAVEKGNYALVLMDCQMPEMDGLEATKVIRKAEALTGRHVPIIGLTAHAMGGDREKCIASGMDDYLSKPASIDQLSTSLKKWIARTEHPVV
ncbi:MAG: response regulator [Candidatus Melainabacteria bacterium]|nr:response regulator [Candidatus Melainabacteria bacterium]